MKITAFNPQIITKDAETIINLFEELGFEKRHTKKDIGEKNVVDVVMKNAEGYHLDISQPEMALPHDIQAIRINVRDFEEAYELFIEDFMGFSVQTAAGFYNSFLKHYLKTDDEEELEKAVRSSSLWAFVRLIGQMKKKPLSNKDRETVKILTEKIRSLIFF